MDLLLQLLSSPDSPWTALVIFGALAWLPIRTVLLKIRRRWRRKDRSILRGGRYTREDATRRTPFTLVTNLIRVINQYVFDTWSGAKKQVSFGEHSDGSVFSKRHLYDKRMAPQQFEYPVEIKTPSPIAPKRLKTRVATPMPKQRQQSVIFQNDKENENPVSISGGLFSNQDDGSKASTTTTQQQPTPYPPPKELFMVAYQPQPAPLVLVEKPQPKKPSFLDKPMDPNFLLPYASRTTPVVLQQANNHNISVTNNHNVSSIKKRKLQFDSTEGPRKRPALSRVNRIQAKQQDPKKRKEREEELLQEFNRKRPKKLAIAKAVFDVAAAPATNPFGSSAPASSEDNKSADGKPTFQFGGTPAVASENKDNDGKPAFQFGGKKTTDSAAPAATEPAVDATKPAFAFGGATPAAPTAPATPAAAGAPAAAFSFGGSAPAAAAPVADAGKAAFTFGGSAPTQAPPAPVAAAASTPAFSFGGSAPAQAPPAPVAAAASTPAFSFGGSAPAQAPPAPVAAAASTPAFSFGGSAPAQAPPAPVAAAAPTPAFAFGGSAPAPPAGAPLAAFTFGGAAPAAAAAPAFSFGGSAVAAPSSFGGAAPAPQAAPIGGTMLPGRTSTRRRAGRAGGRRR